MEDLLLKGILDGKTGFIGPQIVQFDLTNRCNNNCLCCWNRSPLLGEFNEQKREENNRELSFDVIKKTLLELKELGTKDIFLAGGGEPFAHPDIMKILKLVKQNGMRVFINTNFTLIDKEKVREIVDLKIDLIHVSLLAGTARTYARVHPNKSEDTFNKIKDNLKYLMDIRKEKKQEGPVPLPHIDLHHVIFNENYKDIKAMVDFALSLNSNTIEFTPVDTIPGKTDSLLLNYWQKWFVLMQIVIQNKRIEIVKKVRKEIPLFIEQYHSFRKRLLSRKVAQGEYEDKTVSSHPCYVGWAFARILADGNVNPCLKAHKISIGNIYNQQFKDIWNSPQEQLFREKSFSLNRQDPYFTLIGNDPKARFGCLKSCDNIQINKDIHDKYGAILKEYGKIT